MKVVDLLAVGLPINSGQRFIATQVGMDIEARLAILYLLQQPQLLPVEEGTTQGLRMIVAIDLFADAPIQRVIAKDDTFASCWPCKAPDESRLDRRGCVVFHASSRCHGTSAPRPPGLRWPFH